LTPLSAVGLRNNCKKQYKTISMKTSSTIGSFLNKSLVKKLVVPLMIIGTGISIWAIVPHLNLKKLTSKNESSSESSNTKTTHLTNNKVVTNNTSNNNNNGSNSNNTQYANYTPVEYSDEDKTLSPYFIVITKDSTDQLPLRSTKADVNIAGMIADVKVTQVYKNDGKNTLEAIYTFPASSKAAVYSMEMFIGNRKVTAVIKEKVQARKDYEEAKENENRASLLEQSRPNVFQMNVANINPGDEITVVLKYTELLVPESGTYEFVYPTVVGPRYTTKDESYTDVPYTKQGVEPTYDFNFNGNISAGMNIQDVTCNTHKINVKYPEPTIANVQLDPSEVKSGNKDFILEYKLAGNQIETGLLLYDHGDEKFFLMMAQPPQKVKLEEIPPREYIFIMDESGSMSGTPIDISKKVLRNLITNLRPTDKFNVLVFSNSHTLLSPTSLDATTANVNTACKFIDEQQGASGTDILPALEKALNLPREKQDLSRSFVILTDGFIDVEKESFALIRKNLNKANCFTIGIGTSVNRYYLEGMAHAGMGELMICTDPNTVDEQAEKFRKYVSQPVLTQIKKDFGKFQAYDVEPLTCPDIMAERPIVIYGKYKGELKGNITISGYTGKQKYSTTVDVSKYKPSPTNVALRYLWAREKIKFLDDYNEYMDDSATVKEVTKLGLKYNLLTAYTSFIAIDKTEVVDQKGKLTTVEQALPLPEGVSNYAVGADGALGDETADYIANEFSIYQSITFCLLTLADSKEMMVVTNIEHKIESTLKTTIESHGEIESITVDVDKNGKVTNVTVDGTKVSKTTAKKLKKLIGKWDFASLNLNREWIFTVQF
jgi:Ca-activated chloride channel homolog